MAVASERYQAVFAEAEDGFILQAADGRISDCNAAACAIYGYSAVEMRGLRLADLVDSQVAASMPAAFSGESSTRGSFIWVSCRRKGGEVFQCELSTKLVPIGEEWFVLACVRDHREGSWPMMALPGDEQPPGPQTEILTVTWQPSGGDFFLIGYNTASASGCWQAITGCAGERASNIFAEHPMILDDLRRVNVSRTSLRRELPLTLPGQDDTRYLSLTCTCVPPGLVVTALEDITERFRVHNALSENEARFRALYRAMPVPTLTWQHRDGEFVLVGFNRAVEEVTEGNIAFHLGVSAREAYHDQPEIPADIERCFVLKDTVANELPCRLFSTGEQRYISFTHAYVPADLVLSHLVDITEMKRVEEKLRGSRQELRDLYAQELEVLEAERRRTSQELHDGLGQYLSTIKLSAENMLERLSRGGTVEVEELLCTHVGMVKEAIRDVRRLSINLRPPILDDLGITATISWFCREFGRIFPGIDLVTEVDVAEDDLDEALKTIIFRVLQESMNNIIKHSSADRVRIILRHVDDALVFTVQDNGRGFDARKVLHDHAGLGLAGMRERVKHSGGDFYITSRPGRGTTVRAAWPG